MPFTRSFAILLTLFALTTGCCQKKLYVEKNPPLLPHCSFPDEICLALVLGSGGARGIAHVGVLEELERANIPIDLIVGCSAGSLVGALYADNPHAAHICSILKPMKTSGLLEIDIFKARYGLSQGTSLRKVLLKNLRAQHFHQLKIPFISVTTDLYSSELIALGGGPLIPAIHASCAIPFVFSPVELHGRIFVDGGVIDPVPVRTARSLGAKIVVAVDIRCLLPKIVPNNLFGVAKRSAEITLLWQNEACIGDADVIIRPELGSIGVFEDKFNKVMYEAGRKAAREAIPKIKAILEKKQALISLQRKEGSLAIPNDF